MALLVQSALIVQCTKPQCLLQSSHECKDTIHGTKCTFSAKRTLMQTALLVQSAVLVQNVNLITIFPFSAL